MTNQFALIEIKVNIVRLKWIFISLISNTITDGAIILMTMQNEKKDKRNKRRCFKLIVSITAKMFLF